MTQVPPMRLSSATIVFAPWPAATRAARTPPDPAPMTKKSTSKAMDRALSRDSAPGSPAGLELDALFLHLIARAREDVGRQLLPPWPSDRGKLLQEDWLGREVFLARRAVEERGDLLELLFRHLGSEKSRRLVEGLLRGLVELGLDRAQRLAQAVPDFGTSVGHVALEFGHHARNNQCDRLLDADFAEDHASGGDASGGRPGGGRGRGRGGGGRRWSRGGGGGARESPPRPPPPPRHCAQQRR